MRTTTALSNVVDVHIANLRRKLDLPESPHRFDTIRGVGLSAGRLGRVDVRTLAAQVRIHWPRSTPSLSALSIGVIALYRSTRSRSLLRSAERDVVEQHTSVLLALNGGETDFDDDAWVVSLEDGSSRPLSENTNVEPPLRTTAGAARRGIGRLVLQEFNYDDHRYVAATKKLSDDEANKQYLITAVNIDSYYDEANSLRTRIWLAAIGLTALCGGVGYLFAKRSLEPARRAMSQQRDFIADAAHEMRTPLAIIRASASHALSRPRTPGVSQSFGDPFGDRAGELGRATARAAGSTVMRSLAARRCASIAVEESPRPFVSTGRDLRSRSMPHGRCRLHVDAQVSRISRARAAPHAGVGRPRTRLDRHPVTTMARLTMRCCRTSPTIRLETTRSSGSDLAIAKASSRMRQHRGHEPTRGGASVRSAPIRAQRRCRQTFAMLSALCRLVRSDHEAMSIDRGCMMCPTGSSRGVIPTSRTVCPPQRLPLSVAATIHLHRCGLHHGFSSMPQAARRRRAGSGLARSSSSNCRAATTQTLCSNDAVFAPSAATAQLFSR